MAQNARQLVATKYEYRNVIANVIHEIETLQSQRAI
jgi:hypothetical protein